MKNENTTETQTLEKYETNTPQSVEKDMNTTSGFYGTLKSRFNNLEEVETIWLAEHRRIKQMVPELETEKIKKFLNSETGGQIAVELLDMPGEPVADIVLMRITMQSRLSLQKWLSQYYGCTLVEEPIDKKMLIRSAIRHEMYKNSIDALVRKTIGCAHDTVWPTPETWLYAENVPLCDLETMWQIIQEKLNYGKNRENIYLKNMLKKVRTTKTTKKEEKESTDTEYENAIQD